MEKRSGIVDAHQHFWRVGAFLYPWMPTDQGHILRRDYLPDGLAPQPKRNGVDRTVLVQASDSAEETVWMLRLSDAHPFIAGVVGWVDLDGAQAGRQLDGLQRHTRLKGARHLVESEPDDARLVRLPKSPVIFSKFATCVLPHEGEIVLPAEDAQVDYEAELAVVIGRTAKNVTRDKALDHVLGYTCFNDVSARAFQFADGQRQRGKSCDTFAPAEPHITIADEIADPHDLRITLRLNGETMQDSNTKQLIFRINEVIEFLSRFITLEPGDMIETSTPPGVGFARQPPIHLKAHDRVEVEIEGVGVLANGVAAAS